MYKLCVGGSNLVEFVEVVLILLHFDKRNWYLCKLFLHSVICKPVLQIISEKN